MDENKGEVIEPMSDEQAADFAALSASADAALQAGEPAGAPVPELPALNTEIAGALMMISKMIAPIFPSVAAIYSDTVCESVGAAVAPVCDKYGWLQGGIGGEYGPEIMCLVIVGPLAWATVEAGRGDLAARKQKPEKSVGVNLDKPVAVPVNEPGQKTVQIGAAVPA